MVVNVNIVDIVLRLMSGSVVHSKNNLRSIKIVIAWLSNRLNSVDVLRGHKVIIASGRRLFSLVSS